jgi:hypothetical protein
LQWKLDYETIGCGRFSAEWGSEMEREFESAVANAHSVADRIRAAGYPHYRACDEIWAALADLWSEGRCAGMSDEAVQAIADKYVEWDDADEAWPREQTRQMH